MRASFVFKDGIGVVRTSESWSASRAVGDLFLVRCESGAAASQARFWPVLARFRPGWGPGQGQGLGLRKHLDPTTTMQYVNSLPPSKDPC